MRYFSSDLHFNHNNIVKYCNRPVPFGDTDSNNIWLNSFFTDFKPGDELYLLGDLWYKPAKEQVKSFFQSLKDQGVTLYIVLGNHDEPFVNLLYDIYRQVFNKAGPSYIKHYINLRFKKDEYPFPKMILSHYPFESWDTSYHGSVHLHGHTHGTLKSVKQYRYDVGIDVEHKIYSMDDIVKKYKEDNNALDNTYIN